MLIRETTEAKIEFHDRYWKNVSIEAKKFIKRLLNPDPTKRPSAMESFDDPWLTTHEPSEDHDLSEGLREHFDPRAKWRNAIAGARALHRLASFGANARTQSQLSAASTASDASSGGWRNGVSPNTDDEDEDGWHPGLGSVVKDSGDLGVGIVGPGDNANVTVTAPPEEAHISRTSSGSHPPASPPSAPSFSDSLDVNDEPESLLTEDQLAKEGDHHNDADSVLQMPGSFDMERPPLYGRDAAASFSWGDILKKLTLRS